MTRLELVVLDHLREMMAVGKLTPSIRELATFLGMGVSGTHRIVSSLAAQGAIVREAGRVRGLRLANVPDLTAVPTDILAGELARRGTTLASLNVREPSAVSGQRTCAADSCGHAVQRGHLMCRTHWFALPGELRDRILRSNSARDRSAFERAVTEARDLIDSGNWRRRA